MRKPFFCLRENKGVDQLCSYDQPLCFHFSDSTISLLLKSKFRRLFFFDSIGHRHLMTGPFFSGAFSAILRLTIRSCNYFTLIFSINPQSTPFYVHGLLYRQGQKHSDLVLLWSWDSPHFKLILHPLLLFQCWMSTNERLCIRSHPLLSSKISLNVFWDTYIYYACYFKPR